MTRIGDVAAYLESIAPLDLAESWDNVGLLVGNAADSVHRIMTALTIVPENVDEAIDQKVDLIVTHHPLPFHPLKRLTGESTPGQMLLRLIRAGISVYSMHTAWDNTKNGINEQLADILGLLNVEPLCPSKNPRLASLGLGAGRVGDVAAHDSLVVLVEKLKNKLNVPSIQLVGAPTSRTTRVGIVCGSGGSMISDARNARCTTFVTGEATFHQALEAQSYGISMLLLGHFASEKFGLEPLIHQINTQFPAIEIWPSQHEAEPIGTYPQ
jgi:dinuclear metal center YbgI/SA1388 family protein